MKRFREARVRRDDNPPPCSTEFGFLASLALLAVLMGCQTSNLPLKVVEDVDLDRYAGRWYEISSFP